LVVRGEKVDHLPGDHDDLANAVAGLVWLIRRETRLAANEPKIAAPVFSGACRGPKMRHLFFGRARGLAVGDLR